MAYLGHFQLLWNGVCEVISITVFFLFFSFQPIESCTCLTYIEAIRQGTKRVEVHEQIVVNLIWMI